MSGIVSVGFDLYFTTSKDYVVRTLSTVVYYTCVSIYLSIYIGISTYQFMELH